MDMKIIVPFLGMILAECVQAVQMIVSKIALSDGMSSFTFVLYSNAIASIVLLPSSLFFHRSGRPPLNFSIVCGFLLLALLGYFALLSEYTGIKLSSPTLGTAMLNLIPGFTFILAVAFRMEKLEWRSSTTVAKSLGTIVSVAGAFIATCYKGIPLVPTPSASNSSHQLLSQQSNWVVGGLFLTIDCIMASSCLIVQAVILKKYPAELIVVFFYCFFVTILSAVVSLCIESDPTAWSIKPRTRFLPVLYSGVFGSAFQVGLSVWCLRKNGPVFVSMFKPLDVVIAAAVGVIFMGDTLYLGGLVGVTVIVIGFYTVMWGKAKEAKINEDVSIRSSESGSQKYPLLQSHSED